MDLDAILVAVGNGPSYGGGLRICPDATLDDGVLEVIVIAAASRRRLLRVFPSLRTGGQNDEPEVTVLRAATVRIDGDPRLAGLRRRRAAGHPAGDHALRTRCAHRRGLA